MANAITMLENEYGVRFYDADNNGVTISDSEVHDDLRAAVFRYGLKQIMADAGAMSKGATTADRLARMQRRRDALVSGTWGLRPARSLVDGDVFDAVVAAGLLEDDERTRTQWANLGKRQRNALRIDARVVPHIKVSTSDAGDSILAMFHVEQATNAEGDVPAVGTDTQPKRRRAPK